MSATKRYFDIDKHKNALILTPLPGFPKEYSGEIEEACESIENFYLANDVYHHVVIDFSNLDDFGSTVLAFFVRLWKRICARDGRLMVCHVCSRGQKVLETTHLNQIWTVYHSREEAIAAVDEQSRLVSKV